MNNVLEKDLEYDEQEYIDLDSDLEKLEAAYRYSYDVLGIVEELENYINSFKGNIIHEKTKFINKIKEGPIYKYINTVR